MPSCTLAQAGTECLSRPPAASGSGPGPADHRGAVAALAAGLSVRFTLPAQLPPFAYVAGAGQSGGTQDPSLCALVGDAGHHALVYAAGRSWLNMAESIQRILVRRALVGQSPASPAQIMRDLEAVAAHWNQAPTPFVWGGKRATRRIRARQRRHALGGSGACTRRPIPRRPSKLHQWLHSNQLTH